LQWWCMPIIPASCEAEIRRIIVWEICLAKKLVRPHLRNNWSKHGWRYNSSGRALEGATSPANGNFQGCLWKIQESRPKPRSLVWIAFDGV
jgi:hypothetical protein